MRLELGSRVRCSDEVFGELSDVVIDPTTRRVSHLVVQPEKQHGLARLVPIALADPAASGDAEIVLRCTAAAVRDMDPVQEFAFLRLGEFPVDDPDWDVGVEDVMALPYYGTSTLGGPAAGLDPDVQIAYDRVPKGEVEIRRESVVLSSDGHELGRVDGLLVGDDGGITHLVLRRGHLWGRREVTIPISAVGKVSSDAVRLSLSRDEVRALPRAARA